MENRTTAGRRRRVIVTPSFASFHLLKYAIQNWIDVLEPDIIAIAEGLMPAGPENKGHIDDVFRKKWCHPQYPQAGFDLDDLTTFVVGKLNERYDGNHDIPRIDLRIMTYRDKDANQCFQQAICPEGELFGEGDIIFPLEPDAFFYEGDKAAIDKEISKLKPGEGLSCQWVDFLETQYYTEAINIRQPKYRRLAYCFDSKPKYLASMDGFMSQQYPKLKPIDKESFFIRHYCWFVSGEYKELRYELIHRSDPQYWKDFEKGLQEVRRLSNMYVENGYRLDETAEPYDRVVLRPTRNDDGRYAKFITTLHPVHIQSHPNWVK
jgi:hypothetical protein